MCICKVDGCGKEMVARGYCKTHWGQFNRRGEIPKNTRLNPNKIIIKGENAEICLCDTLGNEKARAVIDKSDIELVKKYKWYLTKLGYAMTRLDKKKQLFLHRLLMNPPQGNVVDHIDGDTLNNKRNNLRLCTQRQNLINQKLRIDNSSGIRGVAWDKRKGQWRARIHVNGKDKHLGYFTLQEDAIQARSEAENKYFGEFARKTI